MTDPEKHPEANITTLGGWLWCFNFTILVGWSSSQENSHLNGLNRYNKG